METKHNSVNTEESNVTGGKTLRSMTAIKNISGTFQKNKKKISDPKPPPPKNGGNK